MSLSSSSSEAVDVPPADDQEVYTDHHLVALYAADVLPMPSADRLQGITQTGGTDDVEQDLFDPPNAAVWAGLPVAELQKMMMRGGSEKKKKSNFYGIQPTMQMALEELDVKIFSSNKKGCAKFRAKQIKDASQRKVREQVPGLDAQIGKTPDGGAALASVNWLLLRCDMKVLTTAVLRDEAGVLMSTQEGAYFFPVVAAAKALRLHSDAERSRKEAAAPDAPKKISDVNMLARLLHVICDPKNARHWDVITQGKDRRELDARKSANFIEPWTAIRAAVYDRTNRYDDHHLPPIEQTNEDLQSIDPNDDSIFDHTQHRKFSAKAFKEAFSALRTAHTEIYRAFHSSGQMGTGDKQGKVSWVDHAEAVDRSRQSGGGGGGAEAAAAPASFGEGERGDDYSALFGGGGGGSGGAAAAAQSSSSSVAAAAQRSSSNAAAAAQRSISDAAAAEEEDASNLALEHACEDNNEDAIRATKSNYPAFCTGKKSHGFSPKLLLYVRYFLEDDESRWSAVTRELTDNAQSSSSIGSKGRTKIPTHAKKGRGSGKEEAGSRMQVVQHQFPESAGEKRKGAADLKLVQAKEQGELLKSYMELRAYLKDNDDDDEVIVEQLASIKEQLTQLKKRRKVVRRVAQGGEDSEE